MSRCQVTAGPNQIEVAITKAGAAIVKAAGIADPAEHFHGKTIRPKGTVKEVDGVLRVKIDDVKQIAVAE